jgi:hypothetical protein
MSTYSYFKLFSKLMGVHLYTHSSAHDATAVQMINTVGSDASSLLHLVQRIKECFGEKEK